MLGLRDSLKSLSKDASLCFVQWLTRRTQQRLVRWQVCPHRMMTFIAGLHGPMLIQFAVNSAPQAPHSWHLFSITSSSGVELFRATPSASNPTQSPFVSAIDLLFLAISNVHRPATFIC